MVRDDLYITVPNLFRCPISLDVMKSPVSLCTGVTYDRASIQRWLDTGNDTCPATMQVLQSKDFVPNRTLQRLIQIWSDSANNRIDSSELDSSLAVPSRDQVTEMIGDLESDGGKVLDYMMKICLFVEESEENRKFVAEIDGFVCLLVDFLCNVDCCGSKRIDFVEQVVRVLDAIVKENEDCEQLNRLMLQNNRDCLSSMLMILQEGSLDSQIGSARLLEAMAIDAESKFKIAEKDGILTELLKLIDPEIDQTLIVASLSCIIAISLPRRIKLKLINHGAIKSLSKLLTDQTITVSITEKVLKLLEMASSCKEARLQICDDSSCLSAIVQKIFKVSTAATEHAVTTLWSVCYLFRDSKAQETVTKSNGLTKILLLMQSNCSPPVRQMAGDLLKIFRVSSKSCLSSYDTKTTHIMPF